MATRFGGVSPAQSYAVKVKWLMAFLLLVIVLLAVAVVFIAKNTTGTEVDPSTPEAPVKNLAPVPESSTIDVLFSSVRIEAGTPLEGHLFFSQPMEANAAPMGVIRQRDLDKVIGKFAMKLIEPNTALTVESISEKRPVSPLIIPPGFRAVTIHVDERSSVEGFARPNTRVDMIWNYTQQGKKKVATIVRFCKVLSVGGRTDSGKGNMKATTVTLLVTERDAKKIELARTMGAISLVLVGDQEPGSRETDPDSVTIEDIIGHPVAGGSEDVENDPFQGVMYTTDPKTGRQMRYTLKKNHWQRDGGH